MANLTGNVGLISSGIQYAIFLVGTAATFFFIDRTGRRPLLIYGALSMATCFFVVGGILGTKGTTLPNGLNGNLSVKVQVTGSPAYAVIAFCYLLVLAYSITLAPVAWGEFFVCQRINLAKNIPVYAAEVWSLETRATGMALASVANWLFNFAIGFFIPPAFQNISWKLFIIFGVLCVGASIQAFISYPETAGKTIEEVELLFSKVSLSWLVVHRLLIHSRAHLGHGIPNQATACSMSAWLKLLLSTDASAAPRTEVRSRSWILRRSMPHMRRTSWRERLCHCERALHCSRRASQR